MTTKQHAPSSSSSSASRHHHRHSERAGDHDRTTSTNGTSDAKAPRKHKKRSSEYSRSHDKNGTVADAIASQEAVSNGVWESFTAPDGRTYYYNKVRSVSRMTAFVWHHACSFCHHMCVLWQVTQESRWKLPKELRNATVAADTDSSDRVKSTKKTESERSSEKRHVIGSKTPISAATLVSSSSATAADTLVSSASSKKNALVQRLQASLAGRINPMANMGPPPMIHIPRGDSYRESVPSFPAQGSPDTNGGGTENGGNATSEEQQYEAETAHMTAAERLRFLRKKRQETMFAKEKIVEEDDFMKEFERNMTKKHDGSFDWRKKREDEHAKEREARERAKEKEAQKAVERKHQQARDEEKARNVREEEREREAENERRRQKEEQEKRERKQEQELAKQQEETENEEQKLTKAKKEVKEVDGEEENGREAAADADDPRERTSSHGKQKENKSKHEKVDDGISKAVAINAETEGAGDIVKKETDEVLESKGEDHQKEVNEDQHKKPKHEKPRRCSEHQEKLDHQADTADAHNIDGEGDEEAAEQERQRLKQEKRERRRLAKLEATVAAQSLDSSPVKKSKKNRKQSAHEDNVGAGEATEQHHQQHQQQHHQPPFSGGGMYQQYPPSPYGYPIPGSMPPHSTGGSCTCCRPHPFVPVHVPPQMPAYPMYYPYAQPPPPPMMMMMPPPMLLQAPPPVSQPGMALVPFAQGQLATNGGGTPAGYSVRPTLDRCEGCRGSGVGLVEKNGFCNHCNRLRLDFIVASARMRQRCSVCGGWGLGLVEAASGKCDHCSRGVQQQNRGSVSRRQSSGETQHQLPPGAVATPFASSEKLKQSGSAKRVTIVEGKKPESIEWDQSSDDGSEWDD